jgi:hypothetical protein
VVKYVWQSQARRVDQWSKSETSEQSRADQNNGNKNRKRCDIITAMRRGNKDVGYNPEVW